ncbi:MAG: hypothetical protein AABW93_00830 [Nanoarchaeota archaeon]
MARLKVIYSEDFRRAKVASKIYARLRDNGLNPFSLKLNCFPKTGEQEVIYYFEDSDKLPKESELVNILKGIKFRTLNLQ